MVSKKIKTLYLISISIFITYVLLLVFNYSEISESVVSHINIKGAADGHSSKKSLWIASLVNFGILILVGLLIKSPQSANYPVEITEDNKEDIYKKMQFFLSIVAIITTGIFSYMIFKALQYEANFIYIISYLIVTPLFTLFYFRNQK